MRRSRHHYRNNGSGRQTAAKYHEAVLELYCEAGREAHRVLRERGVIVVKCQDEVCSNRQRFTHIEIIQAYEEMGFTAEDLFVVVRTNRPGVRSRCSTGSRAQESLLLSGVLETRPKRWIVGASGMSAIELLVAVIRDHTPASIWTGSPVEQYRHVGNTNRGEIGEDFVRRYLRKYAVPVSNGSRTAPTDLKISGRLCEVKTASLGATGTFQFNHTQIG